MLNIYKCFCFLSLLVLSACSQQDNLQTDNKPVQENKDEIIATGSPAAAMYGYLHFKDECIVVKNEGAEDTQLLITDALAQWDKKEKTLTTRPQTYQESKVYKEGDYIAVGGGGYGDSDAFKKENNIPDCDGLRLFHVSSIL